ncbi:MAG: WYL domain-containing protein, partial [Ruminococcus sp.]|nr:WYL domain-containing protein [Candidatus Copronaster equi]
MGKENHGLRLLFLRDIFYRQTDENHAYSALDLVDILNNYGIECERKTIYRDIETLQEYGLDIVNVRTPIRGYYLRNRDFDIAEVRLLIDAVQAAKFISTKNTKSMIYKIGGLVSEYQEEKLREQIYFDSNLKSEKEDLYETIKQLDNAIKNSVQAEVVYAKRKLINRYLKTSEGKTFIVNPYSLLWSNDHYYLICNNDKYNNLMHLRLDRILSVRTLENPAKHFSKVSEYKEKFDTADYSNRLFNMFSGEPGEIVLKCSNTIIDEILEKFGDR